MLEHDRAKNLFEKGALPRQRLDARRHGAPRRRGAARSGDRQPGAGRTPRLRRAREVQRDTTITSPVTGFVVERNYDAGAIPGDKPVVVVADLREMKLEAGVSELEAGRLRVGMKARRRQCRRSRASTFTGQLAAIAPEVDERNRHFKIDVRVPNTTSALLSGMYATARIIEATAANAIVVPREAVTTRDGKRVRAEGPGRHGVDRRGHRRPDRRRARADRERASPPATPCSPMRAGQLRRRREGPRHHRVTR